MPRHPSFTLAVRALAVRTAVRTAVCAATGAAVFALVGCSQSSTPASPGASSPGTSSPGTSSGTPVPEASTPLATAGAAGSAGGTGTPGNSPAGSAPRCEPDRLTLSVVLPDGPDPHGALLRFVNTGAAACRMSGFPGVDLLGPDDPTFGPTYQVPRASAAVPTVTLAPRSPAHAVLHFLTPQEGRRWIPTRISVTPPDTTRQLTSAWPAVPVLRQDAATHPGTYIGPVLAGAGSLADIG